ncbi:MULTISPECIES: MFS transporter [unclassified Undibacterium]|uniref:MFS transporter n=1 Tax=unclassified Undibacterium TaxID=2630295 RepID=UPI002AC97715|nr:MULTISPECIES: MFS transporter [unclassified Undibacterium]MEB0140886.1 MFS transporter [Undibacterium sp. CCC2.1]MEB0173855.1 MFS transporter [Undibacterium sp. CCC1.1]MEB0177859.1 MFS transporter [Undibacterium sp. CCC3.4]MEB0217080.1 MFS transporter [Undibacterium sp. 5I2]WPX45506.1 MFS transporter [Undibacterium sp. CCC3.4]
MANSGLNTTGRGGRSASASTVDAAAVYRKVTWRIVPFLMLCYIVAYLDRVNVGFAKLQMLTDLKFSETVFGLGAGVFFIGYFLFEVPSNIILHRVGARVWIARIMITWAVLSGAFMFVTTPFMFYVMRFLLGLAEAGFFPGIILYLTYWYPAERRSRMVCTFMTAIPLAGVIGGPLSGWIMESFSGVNGLTGWQWMFILEAIPAIFLGLIVLLYLDDGIRSAKWLTEAEKCLLEERIDQDSKDKVAHPSLRAVFSDVRVWLMALIYFCCVMGQYGLTFWMPTLIKTAGIKGVFNIGLFTAIPYSAAVITMLVLGRSSDKSQERRWHLMIPMLLGAVGLVGSALAGTTNTEVAIVFLTIAAAGVLSSAPLFWSLPTAFLNGVAAAAGIAAINSVGNLAGFASPYLIGAIKDLTHSTDIGMYALAGVLVFGALVVFRLPARMVNR